MSTILVNNLSPAVTYDMLYRIFGAKGPCEIQKKDGCAFVEYESEDDALKALVDL